ncbi:MAG TPA: hypothetical protein PLX20_08695 [Rhodocyclaceae bacterium]|nr:hypothetical protein [Rhodocyclaceae bacterium]HMV53170.1 hypothetical protein [Rhodocyclaceae bacterium]HMZ84250.1 hypothetical protein [Rhodocyclaceae bacterium]HNB79367.1 hypothetical protein [Rhodocyclaceae bacterium]HNC61721.1 hypothetical protein [Rhodocyclaceae bacterium]
MKFANHCRRSMLTPALLLLALVPATGTFAADVAPSAAPPAYVEECSAEKRCAPGDEADNCRTDFGKPDACKQKHAKDGFVFACKTRNPSRWNEIWCRPGKSGAAAPQGKQ